MSLKQSQKNAILERVKAAGYDPADFTWSSAKEVQKPRHRKFQAQGVVRLSFSRHPWVAAYLWYSSNAQGVTTWYMYRAPDNAIPASEYSTGSFDGLLPMVTQWLKFADRELAEPQLWPEETQSDKTSACLLLSQLNEFYRILKASPADMEGMKWTGSEGEVTLSAKYGHFHVTRAPHNYAVKYGPAQDHPSGSKAGQGWKGVVELLGNWAQWLAVEQRAHLSPVVATVAPKSASQPTRLVNLRLNRIRAFESFSLPFSVGDGTPRMTTLVIGPNGAGKSTLLRAIALALCPKVDANVLLSLPQAGLVDLSQDNASIELDLRTDGAPWTRRLVLRRDGEREEVVEESGELPDDLFIYASGSGRAVESMEESRKPAYRALNAVKSLFAYDTPLATAELTLRRARELNEAGYPALLESLKRALGLTPDDRIELPKGGGVLIDGPTTGRPIPLSMWADGYRLTMSWLLDLFAQALAAEHTQPERTAGLLLIDEVERHLHPALQAALLDRLRLALPNMQIVATTHSPMTALGALDGDLVVLHVDEKRRVTARPGPRNPALSVEDLITDERGFDAAPYAPEVQQKLDEYNELAVLDPPARSELQKQRLGELASELTRLEALDSI